MWFIFCIVDSDSKCIIHWLLVNYLWLINQWTAIPYWTFSSHLQHPYVLSFTPSPLPSQVLPSCDSLAFLQLAKLGDKILSWPAVFSANTNCCPHAYHKRSCFSQYKVFNHTKQVKVMISKSLMFYLCMIIPLSWSPGTIILMVSLISLTNNWNDSCPRVVLMIIPYVKNLG